MINGYVNIPSELEPLGNFFVEKTVPGIYKKMEAIIALKKPIIGYFSLAPVQPTASIFSPVVFYAGSDITIGFVFGGLSYNMRINSADQVVVLAGD